MAAPNLATEQALAGNYPANRFNQRERKLLQSVYQYVIGGANITLASLSSGIAPSHVVKYAGSFTTLGGDASESITVTGAAATDLAFVVVKTAGATPRSIVAAAAATNAINVTMSGDPSTDHVLAYQILRAAS